MYPHETPTEITCKLDVLHTPFKTLLHSQNGIKVGDRERTRWDVLLHSVVGSDVEITKATHQVFSNICSCLRFPIRFKGNVDCNMQLQHLIMYDDSYMWFTWWFTWFMYVKPLCSHRQHQHQHMAKWEYLNLLTLYNAETVMQVLVCNLRSAFMPNARVLNSSHTIPWEDWR